MQDNKLQPSFPNQKELGLESGFLPFQESTLTGNLVKGEIFIAILSPSISF